MEQTKSNTPNIPQFFYFNFSRLNTNDTNFKKPSKPELSYVLGQTYRQFLTFGAEHMEQTATAKKFVREKPNTSKIPYVSFVLPSRPKINVYSSHLPILNSQLRQI